MKRLFSLMFVMLAIMEPVNLWAQDTAELTTIETNYVLICDEYTENGTGSRSQGSLFGDNHFLDVTGQAVSASKGQVDLSVVDTLGENLSPLYVTDYIVSNYGQYGKHYNSLRLKNAQDVISMKVKADTRLMFFIEGNKKSGTAARIPKISKSADLSDPLNDAPTEDNPATVSGYRYDFIVPEDMQIYVGSYNGDMYVSYIIAEVNSNITSKPTFSHNENSLSMYCATGGASIYYTTDGSTPTNSSTLYTGPITMTQNCTVKAIAMADGYENSEIAIYNVNWFSEEGLDTLEIYAVETGSTITPNQPIMATQSVVVTPGNDVEWLTNMSMGSAWANPLDFISNIYYPGSTMTYTFEGSMRGTNNPKDSDLEDGVSTGSGYKPYQKNYPKSGGFLTFEVQQEGSLIVPIRVFAGKPLYVTDKTGTAKKDIQFKDASGQTLALQTNPLCAVSADEDVTGFVSFNVQPGEKYYVFSVGSKARFGGYVFSKQAIDIDPATMANVIDSLDALPTTLEPYAVLTTDSATILSQDSTGVTYGKTLTFYYDNQKEVRNGMSVGPFFGYPDDFPAWHSSAGSITQAVFDVSFANCSSITSTAYWFYECSKLSQIEGIENLKTDSVTDMNNMFRDCSSLTTLDVSSFNTANVTNMGSMFRGCSGLTTLDVSGFKTDNVTYMSDMFNGCSGLTSLDVSSFNTANVTYLDGMFYDCSGLTSLDVSGFKTDNVTGMSWLFSGCTGLTNLDVSGFKTDNVMNMFNMFSDCSGLRNLDVSGFKTDNVTDMSWMFSGCTGLTSLDLSNFKTDKVRNMSLMFYDCSGLTSLDVSYFNTANVTYMSYMFSGCSSLTSLDVSNFNTANVTYMNYMFYDCSGLTNLDVSNFNTANVTNMSGMFDGCSGLTTLDVSHFKTDNVTDMSSMFFHCSGLTSLDVSGFKTDNVTDMSYMFDGCSALTSLDVSGFKTDNVTDMEYMFYGCSSLTTIYAGNVWSTAAVTEGGDMFTGCTKLVGGAGTAYDSNHIDYTYAHIDGGASNPGYFTAKNQETDNTFSTCAEVGAGEDGKTYRVKGRVKSISNTTFGNWYIEDATDSLYIYGTVDYVGRYPRDGMSWESYGINVGDTVTVQGPKSAYKGVPELVDVRVLSPITLLNVSSNDTAMIAMINRESIRLAPNAATVTAKLYYAGSNCEVTIPDHAQSWLTLQSIEANNGDAEAIFSISDNITTGKRGAEVLFKTSNDSIVYETALFISQNDLELSPYAVLTTDSTVVLSSDSIAQNTLRKTWDFRNGFSAKTVNALKTDLEEFGDSKYWRNYENDSTKTDEQHFWNASKDAKNIDGYACTHNGGIEDVIDELEGLSLGFSAAKKFVITYDGEQAPDETGNAPGGMYPYGKSYIWLNGKNETIKFNAEVNQTIKIAVESHNVNQTRGISLTASAGSLELVSGNPVTTYYTECEWNLTGDAGTVAELTISSTNGCHIYYIIVGEGDDPNANKTTGITYGKTLTFYYDDQKEARNGMSVGPFDNYQGATWYDQHEQITTVVFNDSFANCNSLTSTAFWFFECKQLTSITGISNLKTDNVTDMGYMFFGCSGLTNLDVSNFKTDNVTDMRSMFYGCSGLTNLDVSNFKTDNVTDMSWMFYGCSGLTNLDVSNFKTDNVTDMSRMFYGCSGLTSLDVSNFKTDIVTDISRMFSGCSGLTSLDVSNFNTDKVNSMWSMFSDCSGLTNLDVSNFKTDNVTDISGMFADCSGLTSLDITNFKTDNVTDMSWMFEGCSGLTSLDVSNFKTDNVTDMRSMFYGCSGLTNLDVSNFNTSNVTDIRGMFSGCSSLTTIYIGNGWSTEAVTNGRDMFYNCTKLIGGRGTTYDENHTDYTYAHIDGGPSNPGYFTDKNAPVIEATFDGRVLAVGGSTTMTDALESVGGRDEVAKTITAIVWNSSATLSNSDLQGLDNPNLLIYVNERSQAPENRNNVVVNGLAMNVVLSDTGSGNCDFYAPQTFTAEMITYSREFKQATQVGVCRGWETISLPFMVQTITHADNGVIAPFGVDTSNKHFWLRQLSTNGLVSATKIEANLPYLISMPNDEKNYAKEYILKGLVTFSAENAVVPKTEPTALALADSSVVMVPALQSVGKSSTVWALNVGQERTQYFEGSTFERDYREVRPFEAYTIHRSDTPAPRFLPINDLMNSATGIETISNVIMTHDNYYHLDGRKVDGKPTKKGLYITNGRKVVIK